MLVPSSCCSLLCLLMCCGGAPHRGAVEGVLSELYGIQENLIAIQRAPIEQVTPPPFPVSHISPPAHLTPLIPPHLLHLVAVAIIAVPEWLAAAEGVQAELVEEDEEAVRHFLNNQLSNNNVKCLDELSIF